MIVIAALLVLLGFGLFVGGLLTGSTALYWGCVAACVVAAGVLVVARRQIAARAEGPAPASAVGTTGSTATSTTPAASAATADGGPAADAGPAATGPDLATGATSVPPATAPPVTAEPGRPVVADQARPVVVEPVAVQPAEPDRPVEPVAAPAGRPAGGSTAVGSPHELPDPPVEEVEVTDLLIIVDLTDEVLVVDEHPRYHLPGCVHLRGHEPIPLPLDEARTDGFTPCGVCRPDRQLADRARARRTRGA